MGQDRVESEGFFEMLWDCDHCGQKGLLAKSQRHCPQCGAPQNPDKRHYPPPDQQTRVEGHEFVGADRTCPACGAPMGAKANNCTQCGAPLDGSREVRGVDERAPAAAPARPRAKKRRIWPYVLLVLAAIVLAIWFFFIRSHSATVTVAQHRWQRAIAIEELGPHQQSAWHDQLPAGATGVPVCVRKERSSRQVSDGEDCHTERHDKKDGTFEQVKKCSPKYKSEPIDDDWCTFTVVSWAKIDDVKASGTGTSPAWPNPPVLAGNRRAGARTETLTLDFGDAGTCDVDDPTWRTYSDGQKVKLEVRARSGGVVCGSL
ncbi:MAG TPA: zinc ribbon domain-containing protein [Kofleriaceae bacterium]|jgi:ribosomal protein L37E